MSAKFDSLDHQRASSTFLLPMGSFHGSGNTILYRVSARKTKTGIVITMHNDVLHIGGTFIDLAVTLGPE